MQGEYVIQGCCLSFDHFDNRHIEITPGSHGNLFFWSIQPNIETEKLVKIVSIMQHNGYTYKSDI